MENFLSRLTQLGRFFYCVVAVDFGAIGILELGHLVTTPFDRHPIQYWFSICAKDMICFRAKGRAGASTLYFLPFVRHSLNLKQLRSECQKSEFLRRKK